MAYCLNIKGENMKVYEKIFVNWIGSALNELAVIVHKSAVERGFWEEDNNNGELIALIHSELSEGLEWLRHGNGKSDHIPGFTGLEEELADTIIRVLDMAAARELDLGGALAAKIAYNKTREHKHGKEF